MLKGESKTPRKHRSVTAFEKFRARKLPSFEEPNPQNRLHILDKKLYKSLKKHKPYALPKAQ